MIDYKKLKDYGKIKLPNNATKTLKRFDISEDLFNELLSIYADKVEIVPDINIYYKGYSPKQKIVSDGKEYLICREFLIDDQHGSLWKQIICRKRADLKTATVVDGIDGSRAWAFYMKLLSKYYKKAEIDACLRNHEAEYNENLAQQHCIITQQNKILKFENCYKYDINGAHNDALREIFPKAAKEIEKLYKQRKKNPKYKAYNNLTVGMLCRKGYRKTYNWIVQRTTKILTEGIKKCGGQVIYINTDGFVVSNPAKLLKYKNNVLGDFKLEFQGTAYTYQDKNYSVIQTNEIKGNALCIIRENMDLSKGKIVTYDKIRTVYNVYEAQNIKEEIREIINYENNN